VGGAIGSQVGKGNGNAVATVLGAVIGSAVGAKVGGDLDSVDRACAGHALELAQDNERVTWGNPATGVTYVLSPVRGYKQDGRMCREFSLQVTAAGQSQSSLSLACQSANGTWQSARREDSRAE
jgi:surface antigen